MIWSVLSSLNAFGSHPATGLFAAVDAPIAMNAKTAEATTAVMIVLIFKVVASFVARVPGRGRRDQLPKSQLSPL